MVRVDLGGKRGEAMLWLLTRLRRLEQDSRVRAVVVVSGGLRGSWATADELRQAIGRLRAAGKRVFAYGGSLSNKDYYVSTAAERIYLDPEGGVGLTGLSTDGFFFREALDRVGIRAELVRIGDYKSAPEAYTRSEPTETARRMRQGLIEDQFGRLVAAVSDGRGISPERVTALIEQGPLTAQRALAGKLVDAVATGEQAERAIRELVGETLPLFGLTPENPHATSYAPQGVAIVHMQGDLTAGRSREIPLLGLRSVGAETLIEALEAASANPQVRAIVLRIDSPGGSATAAEVLARQLAEIGKRKPVVCSLGDVAASGGYYVAAPCATIFASPSTITGSIGIFGGKVDVSGLLDWVRVRRLAYQRGSHADQDSPFRPYTESERENLREQLQQGYERFLDAVARGRGMTAKEVDERGQGRVLTGKQALALRLVDQLGGLSDAIAEARRRGGLAPEGRSPLFYYPQRSPSLLVELLSTLPNLLDAGPAVRDAAGPATGGAGRPVGLLPLPPGEAEAGGAEGLLSQLAAPLLPGLSTALLLLDGSRLLRLDPDLGLDSLDTR
jgi:protease-4